MSLFDYGINESIVPSEGGWHYLQPFGASGQRIPVTGGFDTPAKLIDAVILFRAQQHIPGSDVEHDIAEFIREVSPQNSMLIGRRTPDPSRIEDQRGIFARCRDWLVMLQPTRPKLVSLDDANERAVVCLKCPQNIKWRAKCLPCNEDLDQRIRHTRQMAYYEHDEQLNDGKGLRACRLHGFLLPVAVFVDRDKLPADHVDAPAECWMHARV